MNTIKTLLVTLVIILIASKESVGQWDIVPHNTVNPLRKDNAVLPTAPQFGKDLKDGKTAAYLRISNVLYMVTATKAVNGSKAEARISPTTLQPENVLYMYEHAVIKPRTLKQLEGVFVTGVKPDNAHFGMFPAFEAGDYGVFTDENGEEITLYKADCLNICVDNSVMESSLASLWTVSPKKQEVGITVYNDNSVTITDSYNTTTTTTTSMAPAWTPPTAAMVVQTPAATATTCCNTVQATSSDRDVFVFGSNRPNVNLNLSPAMVGNVFGAGQQRQQQYQQPYYPSGPTWTRFNPPPVGGEGYGGGTYTGNGGYGSGTTVPIGGDGGYGGGSYTGFN